MAHTLLLLSRCLTKRAPELVSEEIRVVAKAVRPRAAIDDPTVNLAPPRQLASTVDERGNADVMRASIGRAAQTLQQ